MSQVILGLSKAQTQMWLGVRRGKAQVLCLKGGDYIFFWDGQPLAVETGEALYYHIPKPSNAITKALNTYTEHVAYRVAVDASHFDFLVGSLLTKVGLPLTRRET